MPLKSGPGSVRSILENMRYIPSIVGRVRNWPQFTLDYVGLTNPSRPYRMRGGPIISTSDHVDAATIGSVFFRQDYGSVAGMETIVDVGANIGAFALYAAFSPEVRRVYACEPAPRTYRLLTENISLNHLSDRVQTVNAAVSCTAGVKPFYMGGDSTSFSLDAPEDAGAVPETNVECLTLDQLFAQFQIERCDLLKMDCEGCEFETLPTCSADTLGRIQRIRLEYHLGDASRTNRSIHDLRRTLERSDFVVTRLTRDYTWGGVLWVERRAEG